jgi:hypothetical protein
MKVPATICAMVKLGLGTVAMAAAAGCHAPQKAAPTDPVPTVVVAPPTTEAPSVAPVVSAVPEEQPKPLADPTPSVDERQPESAPPPASVVTAKPKQPSPRTPPAHRFRRHCDGCGMG